MVHRDNPLRIQAVGLPKIRVGRVRETVGVCTGVHWCPYWCLVAVLLSDKRRHKQASQPLDIINKEQP